MIKRLFRKRLRYKLLKLHEDASETEFEEIFDWVYKAPIWEWEYRIQCEFFGHRQAEGIDWISRAEELYALLSK